MPHLRSTVEWALVAQVGHAGGLSVGELTPTLICHEVVWV